MTSAKRKRIIIIGAVTYICCCSYIQQVSADRDAISLNNYFKRIREKREEKKRKKLERQQQAEYVNPYDTSIKKKKRSAGDSLLVRSFLLACLFWVIKLSLPHIITWLAELCRDISRFKRSITNKELRRRQKKKKKQAKEKEEANTRRKKKSPPSSSQQDLDSISPSVLSIIEMGNAADDDGSSFISTGTGISTLTSVTEYISSSFRGRRRQKVTSERVAHHHSNHEHTTKSSKPSRSSSNHETLDEEKGITKSKLHFIEEDDQGEANGNTTTKKRSSKEKKENLDDVSCLPIVGGNQDEESGKSNYNHRARKK